MSQNAKRLKIKLSKNLNTRLMDEVQRLQNK